MYPNPITLEELAPKRVSSHVTDAVGFARCYLDGSIIRVEELQTDIFDRELALPSGLKKKYGQWDKLLLLGLEHFAATSGYDSIEITPAELQMRKWANHRGLRGVTAYRAYTKAPQEM